MYSDIDCMLKYAWNSCTLDNFKQQREKLKAHSSCISLWLSMCFSCLCTFKNTQMILVERVSNQMNLLVFLLDLRLALQRNL